MRTNAGLTSQLQEAEKERTEALVRLDAINNRPVSKTKLFNRRTMN